MDIRNLSRWHLVQSAVALAALVVFAGGCGAGESVTADLVLRGGKVVTVDESNSEVEAVAVIGDRIAAVGSDAEIEPFISPQTQVVELEGRLAVPGLIEGHGHFLSLGESKTILDLTESQTWDEIVAMVGTAVVEASPGEWIRGRGWHQERWDAAPSPTVDGVPLHHELSAASPENPVYLTHASGHASFANAVALELAGITRDTGDPPGGEIIKDESGEPTGLLRETAQRLVGGALAEAESSRTAEEVRAERVRQVQLAGEEALSKGITSFHDAGASFAEIDLLRELADAGELPIRVYAMVRRASNEEMAEKLPDYRMVGYGNDFLTVRSIKRQIDGALGAHGAWLLEPYEDLPTSVGLVLEDPEDIRGTAEIAIEHGYQLNTHAIGDRANREVLNIYEEVMEANPESADLRWRIEHAQHLDPADVPRFVELGLIASMQGVHATSDGPWVPLRIGEERAREGAYIWRTLLDAGVVVTNGTDTPVERIDPLASFYSSVTRMTNEGSVFYPEQRMTREEALRSYTLDNAYAAFEEETKGSITAGKLADIVVLSRDIMTVPDAEILDAEVDLTILGGEIRYARPGNAEALR